MADPGKSSQGLSGAERPEKEREIARRREQQRQAELQKELEGDMSDSGSSSPDSDGDKMRAKEWARMKEQIRQLKKEKKEMQASSAIANAHDTGTGSADRKGRGKGKGKGKGRAQTGGSKAKKPVAQNPPADTATPMTAADLKSALARNSSYPGVMVANHNIESSRSVLAGYLGFDSYASMKLMFNSSELVVKWCQDRQVGFRVPDIKKDFAWQGKTIFQAMRTLPPQIFNETLPLSKDKSYPGVKNNTSSFGYVSWAIAMGHLIQSQPDHFPDTQVTTSHRTGPFSSEDCFRAMLLLRQAWTEFNASEAENTRQRSDPAVQPVYLTQADLDRYKAGGQAGLSTTIDKDNPQPAVAEQFVEMQERWDRMQEELIADGFDWEASGRIESLMEAHKEETKDMHPDQLAEYQEQLWKKFEESDHSLWIRQLDTLGTSDLSLIGRRFERPPMTTAQLKSCLLRNFKRLGNRIIHNEPILLQHDTVVDELLDREEREEGLLSVDPHAKESRRQQSDKAFWELQRKTSKVAAPTPEYDDACELLSLDPEEPVPEAISTECRRFVLKPWQVTGVAWMMRQEASVLGGGVVADDCGVGKTVLTLALIYQQWLALVKRADAGEEVEFRPTLVLSPTPVIDVWFQEWSSLFQGRLKYLQFQGSKSAHDIDRQGFITETKAAELRERLNAEYPPSNRDAGRLIILSSYSTWHRRTLRDMPVQTFNQLRAEIAKARAEKDAAGTLPPPAATACAY